jgi:hypothetical protein
MVGSFGIVRGRFVFTLNSLSELNHFGCTSTLTIGVSAFTFLKTAVSENVPAVFNFFASAPLGLLILRNSADTIALGTRLSVMV